MGRKTLIPLPSLKKRMDAFGENIRLARLRRAITLAQLAERAGITSPTLRAIERGDGAVSFGAYANVLFCLGLDKDLEALAKDDTLGRKLQDINLTLKKRPPRRSKSLLNVEQTLESSDSVPS